MRKDKANDLQVLQNDLNHWVERKDNLLKWIKEHDLDHTDFYQNLNDMRNAECKAMQIESRMKRLSAKTKVAGLTTVAIPILISTHFSI